MHYAQYHQRTICNEGSFLSPHCNGADHRIVGPISSQTMQVARENLFVPIRQHVLICSCPAIQLKTCMKEFATQIQIIKMKT